MKWLVLTLAFAVQVFPTGDAMYGLKWGVSPNDLKSVGVNLTKTGAENNLFFYTTNSLPKNISIAKEYTLVFEGDTSLVKVGLISQQITNDIAGIEGKQKFDEMFNLLKLNYKLDNTYMTTGNDVYKERDEFYQCLKYNGCGVWAAVFKSDNKSIGIELEGTGRGEGYIQIMVEAIPEFKEALKRSTLIKKSKDLDAFK